MAELKAKFSLKDQLFNPTKVAQIAQEISEIYPRFKRNEFIEAVVQDFPKLELKERIEHITNCLKKFLPSSYEQAIEILIQSLPAPCDPNLSDNDFGDFIYAPYNHFVAIYGCSEKHLALSLSALEELTTRFSCEDAIRYFINAFPKETLKKITEWTNHSHYHVRRLASEGTRPKLPWSQKISLNIEDGLSILGNLYHDPTRYVTRSVANHLNDISKENPKRVIETLARWKETKKQDAKEMDFIVRHALRTLIKKGDVDALALIGIQQNPPIEIPSFTVSDHVALDDYLKFEVEILAQKDTTLLLDYIIHFQNKGGEMKNRKVYKFKQVELKQGERLKLSKKHLFKSGMSTRTLYTGTHLWELQINGKIHVENLFELTK